MMATFALFAVSIGLDGAALYMPQWRVIKEKGVSRGLWKQCIGVGDSYTCNTIERTVTDNLAIAFLLLSAICKIPPFLLSLCKSWRFEKCRVPLTVVTGLADAWTIAAISTYAASSTPDFEQPMPSSYGLSFEITIGNAVMTLVLTIACWHVFYTKELLDHAPKPPTDMIRTEKSPNMRILF